MRTRVGGTLVRALAAGAMRRPTIAISAWIAFLLVSAIGALGLRFDTSTSSFLDVTGESWSTYQRSLKQHGGDEFVSILYRGDVPFDTELLESSILASEAIEALPQVARVDSLASVALIRPGASGGVNLNAAFEHGAPRSDGELGRIRQALREDLIAPNALISRDETAFAFNVVLDEMVLGERSSVVQDIERLAGADALVSGVPVFRTRVNSDTRAETMRLTPLTVAMMSAVLIVALRSFVGTALPLVAGGIGTLATVGLMGATETPLSLSTMILPSVLLALGCAYSMHVVVAAGGATDAKDLRERVLSVVVPVALSGLTTTLGFLAIAMTPVAAIRDLSLFGAYGVLVVSAVSVSLTPAVLSTLRNGVPHTPTHSFLSGVLADVLSRWCTTRPAAILLVWASVAIISAFGIRSLTVSTDIISWYPWNSAIRAEYREIRDAVSGISPVSVFIEATGNRTVTEPDTLAAIDGLSRHLQARSDVGKALSLGDPMRLMRSALTSGPRTLPKTRSEAEQYLLLLEGEEPTWDVVSRDYRSARVVLRVDDNSSRSILDVGLDSDRWWSENGPSDFRATPTGLMYEFAREQESIVRTQIIGLLLALGGVAFVLWVVMKSALLACIALVPNLIPLTAAFGAMGWFGVPLDAATACLGSLALGVAVDDTIHVAAAWSRERESERSPSDAIRAGLSEVMAPLVLSSVAIAIGFGVLGFSDFVLIRNLGVVTAGVVLVCWAADVTLLPVLLRLIDSRKEDRS